MVLIRCFLLFLLLLSPVGALSYADEPPVYEGPHAGLLQQLTDAPKVAAASLSAYGHYVSALVRTQGGDSQVAVWPAFGRFEQADILPYTRSELNWLAWVGEGRLLLSLREYGLVLYDAPIGRLRPLIDNGGPRPDGLTPVLLSALPDDPRNILMQWEDPAVPGYPAVFQVNAITGVSTKIIGAWRPIIRWWASPTGTVEIGEAYKGRRQLMYGRRAEGNWEEIADNDYFRQSPISIVGVEAGGATAAVISSHAGNTRSLWRMDARTGSFIKQLASTAQFDISAAIFDPESSIVVGATYIEDSSEQIIWQPQFEDDLKRVKALADVKHASLVSRSRDGRVSLYRSSDNWRPNRYFLAEENRDTLFEIEVGGEAYQLPKPRKKGVWINLKGKRIKKLGAMHAMLSEPEGGGTGKAVVMVHGGPVRRVSDRYSPMVSWLTANGYTVLQPNFRGSSGFGEAWRRAGYARWGTDMQDDVRTAAEWMLETGHANKGQMCVMGGSYGGYAALMSSIKDDDLFECAVSLNGVTSVHYLVEYLEQNRFSLLSVPRIKGNLSDRTLKRRSPLNRADLVRLPVLLLHATRDSNVPFDHGVQMAKSLRWNEKDYEFIVLKGSEHQLRRPQDRRTYFSSALRFLEQHIGDGSKTVSR